MDENVKKHEHHVRQEICLTRAPYREGRKPTAVKVYTVNDESRYLLVQGVPDIGASSELIKLFEVYGDLEDHSTLDNYPKEQFQVVHLFKYKKIQSARFAKKKLDDWSFYGGVLHVCYAPELETVEETREKLRQRRKIIESKIRQYKKDGTYDLNKVLNKAVSSLQNRKGTEDIADQTDNELESESQGIRFVQGETENFASTSSNINHSQTDLTDNFDPKTIDEQLQGEGNEVEHTEVADNQNLKTALEDSLKSVPYLNWQSSKEGRYNQHPSHLNDGSNSRVSFPDQSNALGPGFDNSSPGSSHSYHQVHSGYGIRGTPNQNFPRHQDPRQPMHSFHNPHSSFYQNFHSNVPQESGISKHRPQSNKNLPSHVQNAIEQARAMQNYGGNKRKTIVKTNEGKNYSDNRPSMAENVNTDQRRFEIDNNIKDSVEQSIDKMTDDQHSEERLRNLNREKISSPDNLIMMDNERMRPNANDVGINATDRLKKIQPNKRSVNDEINRDNDMVPVMSKEQLILPPPPKQRQTGMKFKSGGNYRHARVPSAQAEFPADFDARLDPPKVPKQSQSGEIGDGGSESRDKSGGGQSLFRDNRNANEMVKSSTKESGTTVNDDSDKAKAVVVKSDATKGSVGELENVVMGGRTGNVEFGNRNPANYKGPVPKFIPRQAKAAIGKNLKNIVKVPAEVNKELRKNAFTLGKRQGPEPLVRDDRKRIHVEEESVNKTIKEIRKRIKDVT